MSTPPERHQQEPENHHEPEEERNVAVPKRKKSRSRTRHRRAQWKAEPVALVHMFIGGREYLVPPRLVSAYRRGLSDPPS
jgi:large subunit ribosomal protein L32